MVEAVRAAGVSRTAGHYWLKESGGVRPRPTAPRPRLRLSVGEREEISRGLAGGETLTAIAGRLGRSVSTVSREVRRNLTAAGYRAHRADRMAQARTRRPRPGKLATNDRLRERVEEGLKARWSPEQISARLEVDFPEDPSRRVSHETIYTSLFVQAKAGLPGELTVHLRTRRVRRRAQRRVFVGSRRIADMRPLCERPLEVAERLVIGHWEGDLIVGRRGQSHIGTIVERHSRYVVLLHLPSCRTDDVIEALTAMVDELPEQLRGTLTWDQGNEMTRHALFTLTTGIPVYFCEPRSPWQRGSNENTNGLLRQYFPKSTDLSIYTPADLRRVAGALNTRPRVRLFEGRLLRATCRVVRRKEESMERFVERCAGLDVHKATVAACVRVPGEGGERHQEIRTFSTTTAGVYPDRPATARASDAERSGVLLASDSLASGRGLT